MNVDFDVGFTIACVCLFIALISLIIAFGGCETIEENIGLTAHSSDSTVVTSTDSTVVANPINNV